MLDKKKKEFERDIFHLIFHSYISMRHFFSQYRWSRESKCN